jgi:hypothetical protein
MVAAMPSDGGIHVTLHEAASSVDAGSDAVTDSDGRLLPGLLI